MKKRRIHKKKWPKNFRSRLLSDGLYALESWILHRSAAHLVRHRKKHPGFAHTCLWRFSWLCGHWGLLLSPDRDTIIAELIEDGTIPPYGEAWEPREDDAS